MLFGKNLTVNKIIKRTSSERSYVINLIKTLEREGLIINIKDPDHKQWKIKQITKQGSDLIQFFENIKEYHKNYFDLRAAIKHNFPNTESSVKTINKSILLHRGWTNEEIDRYPYYIGEAFALQHELWINMIYALIIRNVLFRSNFNPEENTQIILNTITSDALSSQLEVMLEYIDELKTNALFSPSVTDFITSVLVSLTTNMYRHRSIEKEVRNVVTCLFFLANPPDDDIVREIESARRHIEIGLEGGDDTLNESTETAGELKKYMEMEGLDPVANKDRWRNKIAFLEEYLRSKSA